MKKEVVAHKDPKSPISEIFRTLRTNIQFINTNKNIQTLLVTSTLPGEGKSWIASNLAVAFAQTGKKVVLIDADMRKGRQYIIFDVPPTPGLSNYLSKVGMNSKQATSDEILDCIQKTEVPNLYLMPSGSIPPNPSELLVSSKMIKVLEKFKQAFDIVVIDGTPCELVTDSVILSRVVDATILVTAHKVTKKDALERVIKSIQNVGGNLTGIVVNKIPISGKKYEKRYYYYGESSENSTQIDNKQIPKAQLIKEEKIEEKEEVKTTEITKKEPKPISIRMKRSETAKSTKSASKKETNVKKTEEKNKNKETKTKTKKAEEDKNKETKIKNVEDNETKKEGKAKKTKAEENDAKKIANTKTAKVDEKDTKKETKPKTTRSKQTTTKKETTTKSTNANKKKTTKTKVEKTQTKKVEPKEDTTKTKTEDILKKMNEYLEKENSKKEKEEKND